MTCIYPVNWGASHRQTLTSSKNETAAVVLFQGQRPQTKHDGGSQALSTNSRQLAVLVLVTVFVILGRLVGDKYLGGEDQSGNRGSVTQS